MYMFFNDRVPSLRRRLAIQIGLTIAGIALLSSGAVIGINALQQDFSVALCGYGQLRATYEIGVHVAVARSALAESPQQQERAAHALATARSRLLVTPDRPAGQAAEASSWLDPSNPQVQ